MLNKDVHVIIHGGDRAKAARWLGIAEHEIIDFSASINPLGVPKQAARLLKQLVAELPHYPEPHADGLAEALSRHHRVRRDRIVCGNGSTELLYLIPRVLRPKRALIPAPTFSEYERACRLAGARTIARHRLDEQHRFDLNADAFIERMVGCDLAFLCNPNNPTGRLMKRRDLLRIARAAHQNRCHLVIDEAFLDFCAERSMMAEVVRNPYLIVLRSLTKYYAIAGLRIGFGVCSTELAERLRAAQEPWTINTLAQKIGGALVNDVGYSARTTAWLQSEKDYVERQLDRLGIRYTPSAVNYYLLKMDHARSVIDKLALEGILVRDCANFVGLGEGFVRIAVRGRRENRRLFDAIRRTSPTPPW